MKYNQTISIKSITETADDGGSIVESETTVLSSVPCLIDPVSSTQRIMAERNGYFVSHRVFMKYNSSVTENMIVTWNSSDYRITYVRNPNNENRTLELDIYKHG